MSHTEYLTTVPSAGEVPAGHIVVHNRVRPARRLGTRGFRAFLTARDPQRYESCDCGWAPEVGEHYRVRRGQERGDRAELLALPPGPA